MAGLIAAGAATADEAGGYQARTARMPTALTIKEAAIQSGKVNNQARSRVSAIQKSAFNVTASAPASPPDHVPIGAPCLINDPPALNCQLPDQAGHGADGIVGATSDADAGFEVVEDFAPTAAGSVTTVCWWGFYLDFGVPADCSTGLPISDSFTIRYYANVPGCPTGAPGAQIAGPFSVSVTGTPTGNIIPSGAGDLIEYEYSATHAGVAVGAGVCTWISIQNIANDPDCVWLWSTAPPGDDDSHQIGAPAPENDFDLALCLNLEMGDLSGCAVPTDPLCVGATGSCGEAHKKGEAGCEDPCCCTLVCAGDTFCCEDTWDQTCADAAIQLGCAIVPLCEGQDDTTCQLYGTLNAYNSTLGTFHAADDFTPAVSGSVTNICWQGAYLPDQVTDSFRVRVLVDSDADSFPDTALVTASQGDGSLLLNSVTNTGQLVAGVAPIFQYDATIVGGVSVTAGDCYWLEIINDTGATSWFWEWSEMGPTQLDPTAPPRDGNARLLIDGPGICVGGDNDGDDCGDIDGNTDCPGGDCVAGQNGFGFPDTIADNDLAFCIGLPLLDPACDFYTLHDTGPHETVLFSAANNGVFTPAHLGWSSGNLGAADPQRWTAQALTLPPVPVGADAWSIEQVLVEGFTPAGVTNETHRYAFYERTALDVAPTPADQVDLDGDAVPDTITVGYFDPTGTDTERTGFIALGLFMQPGDYWLINYADNASGGAVPSNFAWFTNGPNGINNVCTANMQPPALIGASTGCAPAPGGAPAGTPAMWRSRMFPTPGMGGYTLPYATQLQEDPTNDPTPDPDDLYNAAFSVRGTPGTLPVACPWDTAQPGDPPPGPGTPDGVVGINDLIHLLANWGPC
jgi:hypothetical protein